MKIAVYAICKNEKANIEKFLKSALEADAVYIADTGSTDGSYDLWSDLSNKNPKINFFQCVLSYFRFDSARNFCLNQIPKDIDYCLFLDLDETLEEGWYSRVVDEIKAEDGKTDEVYMDMIYSVNSDGTPASTYYQLKMHNRNGYTWRYPCHEVLLTDNPDPNSISTDIKIYHNQDTTKERNYGELLEKGATERPDDQRALYYYGRDLFFKERYTETIDIMKKAVDAKYMQWTKQKAACYKYIAFSVHELSGFQNAEYYYLQYFALSLDEAEAFYEMAQVYYDENQFELSKGYLTRLLKLVSQNTKTDNFIYRDLDCWTWKPHDLLAYVCYSLGDYQGYLANAVQALEQYPGENERLRANVMDAYQHLNPEPEVSNG